MNIEIILITIGLIAVYFVFGLFTDMIINLYFNYENPLWKIVTVILWPIAKIYLLGYLIAKWVISVIEYYKETK